MRRFFCLLILLWAAVAQGANELFWRDTKTGQTEYATIRNASRQYWNTQTPALESLTVANWANYAVTLSETPASSYFYVGSWPAALSTAGWYWVDVFEQAGGSPAISDTLVGTYDAYWDGSNFAPQAAANGALPTTPAGTASTGLPLLTAGGTVPLPASGSMPETANTVNIWSVMLPAIYPKALAQNGFGGFASPNTVYWPVGVYNGQTIYVNGATFNVAQTNYAAWSPVASEQVIAWNGSNWVNAKCYSNTSLAPITGSYAYVGPSTAGPTPAGTYTASGDGSVSIGVATPTQTSLVPYMLQADTQYWNGTTLGGVPNSGNVTIGGYAAGQDPATLLLKSPANLLTTDSSGNVTVGGYAAGQAPLQATIAGRTISVDANGNVSVSAAASDPWAVNIVNALKAGTYAPGTAGWYQAAKGK
jgi:hypothetical protein